MHLGKHLLLFGFTVFLAIACKDRPLENSSVNEGIPAETVANVKGDVQIYQVVPSATIIHWEGYKPAMGVTHEGTVNVSQGQIFVENNMVSGGNFTIDFRTIADTDLEGSSREKLEAHLKGTVEGKENDFFNINKYPTGLFEITKVTSLAGNSEANAMIYGNLTIKDITRSVGFTANLDLENGVITATTPLFKIDRTEFGIQVLSKKFFDNLKDNFVADEFGIRIELRAETGKDI